MPVCALRCLTRQFVTSTRLETFSHYGIPHFKADVSPRFGIRHIHTETKFRLHVRQTAVKS